MILDAISVSEKLPDGVNDGVNSQGKLTELDKAILQLIREDAFITIKNLALQLDKSVRTIERRISYLKQQQLLIRVGAKKTGRWQVN